MKIAFPSQENLGFESPVYGHFGSASLFVIVDTDADTVEVLENRDKDHDHGHCQPLAALGNQPVDAVVVGGIGLGALNHLSTAGIETYRAVEGTVSENLNLIKTGKLPRFTPQNTCAGHHSHHGCAH